MIDAISLDAYEQWCATCPTCGQHTTQHSIDGGLTSQYHGECGHRWEVNPHDGKVPND